MKGRSDCTSRDGSEDMPGAEEELEDWDDWEEDESSGVQCLLSKSVFPTVEAVLEHDRQQGFDLVAYMRKAQLEQYDVIKVINYIRHHIKAGRNPVEDFKDGMRPWDEDMFFQPVLQDDELLFHDWEETLQECSQTSNQPAQETGEQQLEAVHRDQLKIENEALRSALQAMQAALLQDEGTAGLVEMLQPLQHGSNAAAASTSGAAAAAAVQATVAPLRTGTEEATKTPLSETDRIDQSYFESYSFFDIHQEMLKDRVRTEAYRCALEGNPSLIKGANVLDVGCGSAILSMFAARGGAATVVGMPDLHLPPVHHCSYSMLCQLFNMLMARWCQGCLPSSQVLWAGPCAGVDGSEKIAKYARANCSVNGLGSDAGGPVTILTGRVETVEELPLPEDAGGKVDVLVSEWMGYALLFESMLDSVLHARDRFLKPDGAILPDLANIYLAAGGKVSTGLEFWDDVYGFTMAPIKQSIRQSASQRAVVRPVTGEQLVSPSVRVKCLDLATMAPQDQDFTAEFRLEAHAGAEPQECHSLVVWFDTVFSERFCRDRPVTLSTSPSQPQTHWVQAVLLLREPIMLSCSRTPRATDVDAASIEDAVAIEGLISFARNKDRHRSLDIALQYYTVHADGSKGPETAAIYAMGVSDS